MRLAAERLYSNTQMQLYVVFPPPASGEYRLKLRIVVQQHRFGERWTFIGLMLLIGKQV